MAELSEEFLRTTIKIWQPYSEAPLTLEDAREIAENMTGLYSYLLELERKNGKEEKRKDSGGKDKKSAY